jgi:RNA polymerase sigma-70 factor (ECF subfamily)
MWDIALNFEGDFRSDYNLLCNVANNLIKNNKAAEDIVQDVFLKLWQKKDLLIINTSYRSYLQKATINASLDYLAAAENTIRLEQVKTHFTEDSPEKKITAKELERSIEIAIDRLPPKCRVIFILSRQQGMKYREIAEHLDISVKTVENQMGIALEKLRSELRPFLSSELISKTGFSILAFFFLALLVTNLVRFFC